MKIQEIYNQVIFCTFNLVNFSVLANFMFSISIPRNATAGVLSKLPEILRCILRVYLRKYLFMVTYLFIYFAVNLANYHE